MLSIAHAPGKVKDMLTKDTIFTPRAALRAPSDEDVLFRTRFLIARLRSRQPLPSPGAKAS